MPGIWKHFFAIEFRYQEYYAFSLKLSFWLRKSFICVPTQILCCQDFVAGLSPGLGRIRQRNRLQHNDDCRQSDTPTSTNKMSQKKW